jgi:universal stress protein E
MGHFARIALVDGCAPAARAGDALPDSQGEGGSVKRLNAILVVIDPFDSKQHVLAKSMVLARHFGAQLELFLCDSEQAYSLKHTYDRGSIEQARQSCLVNARCYLESLRSSVMAVDVAISLDVACESPLYEGIVQKVMKSKPDLVLKSAGHALEQGQGTLDANEWELARACPVPLMLTRGRPWRAQPRFAAAVDVSENESGARTQSIMRAAEYLARGCQATLDVVYSERHDADAAGCRSCVAALHELGAAYGVAADHVHVLTHGAEGALPEFLAAQRYDMLVLGALTHRPELTAVVGTLTSKLVDSLDCDFVLVRNTINPE